MKSVVIIGAGQAGAEAAFALRKKGWTEKIILIGEENEYPYRRPPLSKAYCANQLPAEKLLIKSPEAYKKHQIETRLGSRVVSINRNAQKVILDNGEELEYTNLVLATGARVRKLPFEHSSFDSIHYLRSKAHVDKIKEEFQKGKHLLIIGAGYIGLEVAATAIKKDLKVTVIELSDRVLARVTSPVVSDFYQKLHKNHGVDIRLNTKLIGFEEDEEGMIAQIANQDSIRFDFAVVGIGVMPNLDLAEEAGLTCENGIVVNEYTQTSDPNIYAIGDCSMHPSFIYDRTFRLESVPNAVAQAKIAASSICDQKIPYNEVPWFWSDQYDIKLQTMGFSSGYDETIQRVDQDQGKFAVFYLKNKTLIAVDALNSPRDYLGAKKLIAERIQPDPQLLADPNIPLKTFLEN